MIAKPSLTVALTGAVLAVLAGCGGGTSKTYSRPALASCLDQNGVTTAGLNALGASTAQRSALLRIVGTTNVLAAKFPSGEFIAFIFAKDAAGAKRVAGKLRTFEKSGLASAGTYVTAGNIVELIGLHPTAGVEKTISTCEGDALVK